LVLPEKPAGMIEASTTRRPSTPAAAGITTERPVSHRAGANRMIDGRAAPRHSRAAPHRSAPLRRDDFVDDVWLERRLRAIRPPSSATATCWSIGSDR
jgi:hypothetical protein